MNQIPIHAAVWLLCLSLSIIIIKILINEWMLNVKEKKEKKKKTNNSFIIILSNDWLFYNQFDHLFA